MPIKRAAILLLMLVAASAFGAIDSENKRASTINVGGWLDVTPEADSTIDAPDRAHLAGEYSGLTPAAPPGATQTRRTTCLGFGIGCKRNN